MSYHCGTCGALEADASNPESHSDWCPVRRAEKAEARVVELEEAIQDFSAIQDDFLDLHERNGVKVPDNWYEAYKTMRLAARGSPSVCSEKGVSDVSAFPLPLPSPVPPWLAIDRVVRCKPYGISEVRFDGPAVIRNHGEYGVLVRTQDGLEVWRLPEELLPAEDAKPAPERPSEAILEHVNDGTEHCAWCGVDLQNSHALRCPRRMTFEQAWERMKTQGYQYGPDALEQVRFGWEIRDEVQRTRDARRPNEATAASLLDELVDIAIRENDRAVKQALRGERNPHTGALWETCFRYLFAEVLRRRHPSTERPDKAESAAESLAKQALRSWKLYAHFISWPNQNGMPELLARCINESESALRALGAYDAIPAALRPETATGEGNANGT